MSRRALTVELTKPSAQAGSDARLPVAEMRTIQLARNRVIPEVLEFGLPAQTGHPTGHQRRRWVVGQFEIEFNLVRLRGKTGSTIRRGQRLL